MKYYVSFKNNLVSCSWEREDLEKQPHPSYIPKEEIYEVTEEQYKLENKRFLILENNQVKLSDDYRIHMINKKLEKLKAKEEKKRHKEDWQKVRLGLSDPDDIAEVDKKIAELDK